MSAEKHPSSPDFEKEQQSSSLNFEAMEAEEIVMLGIMLARTLRRQSEWRSQHQGLPDEKAFNEFPVKLAYSFDQELSAIPARDLDKARQVVFGLDECDDEIARSIGINAIGEVLRYDQFSDYVARQKVIDLWVDAFDPDYESSDPDRYRAIAASRELSRVAIAGWLDPGILRYLIEKSGDEELAMMFLESQD